MNIMIQPIVTEKANAISEAGNRYSFKVSPDANKFQIKDAIEKLYDVKVVGISTMNYDGKRKQRYTKSGIILYNAPVRNLSWFVDSGWGMRFERLAAEFDRIEKYSAMGHLANAEEVIEYQKWKESKLDKSSESISLARKN